MDYNTLIAPKSTPGSIADWVNDSRIATDAPFIVDEAFSMIYGTLRHWEMMPPLVSGTLTVEQAYIPQPGDMIEPYYFALTGQNRRQLKQITLQECVGSFAYDQNGNRIARMPSAYYFDNTNLELDTPPDQAYPYVFSYFQKPAALSATNPTNFLTNNYQRLVRAAIMTSAVEWLKESGQGQFDRTYWLQVFNDQLQKAQIASDRAKRAVYAGPVFLDGGPSIGANW